MSTSATDTSGTESHSMTWSSIAGACQVPRHSTLHVWQLINTSTCDMRPDTVVMEIGWSP